MKNTDEIKDENNDEEVIETEDQNENNDLPSSTDEEDQEKQVAHPRHCLRDTRCSTGPHE